MTDYPLLCYLQKDEQGHDKNLVMVHLADTEKPEKIFKLTENQTFVQFIDQTQKRHSACIKVLIYDDSRGEQNEQLIVQSYRYEKPCQKKDFSDDAFWNTQDRIEIALDDDLKSILIP